MLLVSLELEEVLSLSDRILVMYEGEIVGEFPPTATEEELGVAMTGGGGQPGRPRERAARAAAERPERPRPEPEAGSPSATRSRSARSGILAPCSPRCSPSSSAGSSCSSRPARTRSTPTRRSSTAPGSTGSSAVGHRRGALHGGVQPPADAADHDAADPHRARRRLRVPLRHVQHRRPGPVPGGLDLRRLDRHVVRRPAAVRARARSRSSPRSPVRCGRASPAS